MPLPTFSNSACVTHTPTRSIILPNFAAHHTATMSTVDFSGLPLELQQTVIKLVSTLDV